MCPWLSKKKIVFRELIESSDFGFKSKLKVVTGCISCEVVSVG